MVLPAPFGPRNPKTSPRPTVIDRPPSAVVVRNSLRSSIVSTAGETRRSPRGVSARQPVASAASSLIGSADLSSDTQNVLLVE